LFFHCFQVPRVTQFQTASSQDGTLLQLSETQRVTKWISFPMLVCHTGFILAPNPHIRFKTCKNCWLILLLGLPVCCQGHLAYLVL
jgi:hypothetical protein